MVLLTQLFGEKRNILPHKGTSCAASSCIYTTKLYPADALGIRNVHLNSLLKRSLVNLTNCDNRTLWGIEIQIERHHPPPLHHHLTSCYSLVALSEREKDENNCASYSDGKIIQHESHLASYTHHISKRNIFWWNRRRRMLWCRNVRQFYLISQIKKNRLDWDWARKEK